MGTSTSLFRILRAVHLYFGVFISPALLFFAFTGALQTFGLHETTRGSTYQPPRWAVVLGQVHKKQTTVVPERRSPPNAGAAPGSGMRPAPPVGQPATPRPTRHALPLKIFFLLVSLGLVSSTGTGIYMAFKYRREPLLILGLLFAGALIPVVLLFV